jgi:RHS repeat-associated protein
VTNITYRTAGGEIVRSFAYAFDLSGMITQKVDRAVGTCVTNVYAYDGLNRLLSESIMQSGTNILRQFTYDLTGNRLAFINNGLTNTYTYGIGNRLSNVSDGTGYTHDNAGNVSRIVRNDATLDLVWNLQGQLLAVTNNGVLAESYTYDPLGRRLCTTTGGSTVYHAYNGDECIADLDASGKLLRSYTWGLGIDNLLAMTVHNSSATNTFYAIKDHLGSVQSLVDSTGNVVESFTYDAWGNILSHFRTFELSNFSCRYMFQGREYSSATGLYNFRARWYDSQTGRWLSNDPIGISGGLNLHEFCGNNPMNYVDPMGEEVYYSPLGGAHAEIVYSDPNSTTGWSKFGFEGEESHYPSRQFTISENISGVVNAFWSQGISQKAETSRFRAKGYTELNLTCEEEQKMRKAIDEFAAGHYMVWGRNCANVLEEILFKSGYFSSPPLRGGIKTPNMLQRDIEQRIKLRIWANNFKKRFMKK